ncbi:MAG TPA: DUF4395 domain-containing protein [Candidatus Limnocylindrales bacterium]|jgi:hypothetical protein|nr:DUF4395 domain-containing protein [Candidatus Limnocylindrales bacterium]
MPNAIPAGAAATLPPARMIDPRGHRFGAAVSGLLLIGSYVLNAPIGVAIALASIGISAAFGLRWSVYGIAWRRLAMALRLGKVEPEHEYPPRFAQTLGSAALVLSLVAFVAAAPALGWALALAVAGLQGLLAVTGYCLGCRLYFLRWWVPDLVTRIWTRKRRTALPSGASGQINFR